MHSLSQDSRALELSSKPGLAPLGVAGRVAMVAALLGAVACSDSEDGAGTVALADSGSLAALTNDGIEIPTTVAVADGVAWVPESQFTRFAAFGGTGTPAPFRLVGIPLDGGDPQYISLPNNFFPEGITATLGGRLFVGSVSSGTIYTVAAGGTEAVPFVPFGVLENAVIGVTASTDGMLWACNTFFGSADPPAPPTGAVVGIGIADGLIKVRHEFPAGGLAGAAGAFCNDLVVSPDGALWATESFGGRLFRIAEEDLLTANSAEVWLEDIQLAGPGGPAANNFGVNGITLLGGRIYVVNSGSGALLRIDPSLTSPTGDDLEQVFLTQNGSEVDLVTPDGITARGERRLLVVENGFGRMDGAGRRLVQVTIDTL